MSAPQIVIAGSGKMARDVGLFFLGCGHPVAWLSRDGARLAGLERWVTKRVRRLAELRRDEGDHRGFGEPSFFMVGEPSVPPAAVLIECINEAEEDKRALLQLLEQEGIVPRNALRLSNSSSISPDALHEDCAGLHFFYPVELTGLVEAIFPRGFSEERREGLRALLRQTGLDCIEQDTTSAFAVNRLLLPLQAEALRLVIGGASPAAVDHASISSALPVGQLALMDTIGLDVVHPAVCHFMDRMPRDIARYYEPLRDGLGRLVESGKRGRKNRDGLLLGAALPWSVSDDSSSSDEEMARLFRALFVNTCHHAVEHRLLTREQLDVALAALFDWTRTLDEALETLTRLEARRVLTDAFEATSAPYFIPASALRGDDEDDRICPDHGLVI